MTIGRRTIEYAGVANPITPAEMRIEILGLRNAIRQAEELISRYEQAAEIAVYMERLAAEERQNDLETGPGGQAPEKAERNESGPPLVR